MDELDRNIIGLLGADARMSIATLARRLKVARSTVQARLERLESSGVIVGYTIKLGETAREGACAPSVLLTVEPRAQANILTRLKAIAEVERVFTTSGRFDLLLQIAAPSTKLLDDVLDQIGGMTGGPVVGKPDPPVHADRQGGVMDETREERLLRTSEIYRRLRAPVEVARPTAAIDLTPPDSMRALPHPAPDPEAPATAALPPEPNFVRRMFTRRLDTREIVLLVLVVAALWYSGG